MLMNKELQKLFKDLESEKSILFNYSGVPITMRVFDEGSKLALSASVYEGGNYIPESVRKGLSLKSPFPFASIKTSFTVDEEHYQISLNYLGPASHINDHKFHGLLEEFNGLALEWRYRLDERDRNDLVHVHVK